MPPKKSKAKKKGKRYRLDLSRTSLFFWCLGTLFLLAWIFVLGILVGRGFFLRESRPCQNYGSQSAGCRVLLAIEKRPIWIPSKGWIRTRNLSSMINCLLKKMNWPKKIQSGAKKAGRQTELAKRFETDKPSTRKVEAPKKDQSNFNKGGRADKARWRDQAYGYWRGLHRAGSFP